MVKLFHPYVCMYVYVMFLTVHFGKMFLLISPLIFTMDLHDECCINFRSCGMRRITINNSVPTFGGDFFACHGRKPCLHAESIISSK